MDQYKYKIIIWILGISLFISLNVILFQPDNKCTNTITENSTQISMLINQIKQNQEIYKSMINNVTVECNKTLISESVKYQTQALIRCQEYVNNQTLGFNNGWFKGYQDAIIKTEQNCSKILNTTSQDRFKCYNLINKDYNRYCGNGTY